VAVLVKKERLPHPQGFIWRGRQPHFGILEENHNAALPQFTISFRETPQVVDYPPG